MVMYRQNKPGIFEMKEFSRDLNNGEIWNTEFSVKEGFSLDSYRIVGSVICYFNTGISDLDSKAESDIHDLLSQLPNASNLEGYYLVIFGHADETGGENRNIELSKERAFNALVEFNTDGKIGNTVLGYFGSDRPAFFGDSALALSKNRRAEILIVTRSREIPEEKDEKQISP
jgi:outer membrane protein OmpA-like peptidoglycan-associated protein